MAMGIVASIRISRKMSTRASIPLVFSPADTIRPHEVNVDDEEAIIMFQVTRRST